MTHVASLSDDVRLAMGQVSRGLASPYTPARWADTVLARSTEGLWPNSSSTIEGWPECRSAVFRPRPSPIDEDTSATSPEWRSHRVAR